MTILLEWNFILVKETSQQPNSIVALILENIEAKLVSQTGP